MRSMIAVLLAVTVIAQPQPEPLLDSLPNGLICNLLGSQGGILGGLLCSGQNEGGLLGGLLTDPNENILLENPLIPNGAVGGLVSCLISQLLGGEGVLLGGGGIGLLSGKHPLVPGGAVGGLVSGLSPLLVDEEDLLGVGVSGATGQDGDHGLSADPVDWLIDRLTKSVDAKLANGETQEDIDFHEEILQLLKEPLTRDFLNKIIESGLRFNDEELAEFFTSGYVDKEGLMGFLVEGLATAYDVLEIVRSGVIQGS